MKINFKALEKFEKTNVGNYICLNSIQQMVDTVVNYTGVDIMGTALISPPYNYTLAVETLAKYGIIEDSLLTPKPQQLNS